MNDDPTEPLGAPLAPGTTSLGTDVCPNGHVLAADQVIVRNGHKVCPLCEQQSTLWAAPIAPRPPVFWTRQALRLPLIIVAAAFLAEGVSSAFGISTAASYLSHQLPGSTAELFSAIFDTLSQLGLATGAGWIAYLVGQDAAPTTT